MKKLVSILVLVAMMLASVLAIVPAAAEDDPFEYYETRRFMPEDVYQGIKALYEKDGAQTKDWVPSVAPFTPVNTKFQDRFAGTRLRTISLPVNNTGATDSNGNFIFTISTFKRNALTNSSAVNSWKIKINAEKYGLQANKTGIYKFVENIDLTSYNIVVAEDEVLAFQASGDTFIPGYAGGAINYFSSKFPEMMGFGAYTGKKEFETNTWPSTVIFFDITYDVPLSESYAKIKELVDTVKDYEKDDFSAGFDAFKIALDAAVAKLDGSNSNADFTAEYTALDTAVKALVAVTEVNKTTLASAISAAAAYENKAADYTATSYAVFTEVLAAAKAVNNDTAAKQSAVNKAVVALNAAIEDLDRKGNTVALATKVENALKYDKEIYTANSYKPLKDAILDAQDLIAANSESYNDIEAVSKAIDDAIAGLKKKADFTKMNELITKYEGASKEEYTEESVNELINIIGIIKEARKPAKAPNVSEETGAEYLARLEAAIAGLVPYATYGDIDARVAEVEGMDKTKYTADSWKAVEDALKAINTIKSDRYATQPEADALLEDLNEAVAALVAAGSNSGNNTNTDTDTDNSNDGEADATTPAGTDSENKTDKTDEKKEGGCGGIITTTAVVMASVLALGVAFVAKKKD